MLSPLGKCSINPIPFHTSENNVSRTLEENPSCSDYHTYVVLFCLLIQLTENKQNNETAIIVIFTVNLVYFLS